jgi:hypothetical protein
LDSHSCGLADATIIGAVAYSKVVACIHVEGSDKEAWVRGKADTESLEAGRDVDRVADKVADRVADKVADRVVDVAGIGMAAFYLGMNYTVACNSIARVDFLVGWQDCTANSHSVCAATASIRMQPVHIGCNSTCVII